MDMIGASGNSISSHRIQTSNNRTVPQHTILKDKEILSYKGPTAFESDRKRSSQSVQDRNDQILARQHNNESCLRKSAVSNCRQTGQSTAVLHRENYPQHESKHFCPNPGPQETSTTAEKLLLQKCPVQLCSSSFDGQRAPSASTTTNISEQSMPCMIVLNTNNLSGSWKNSLHNRQQHVKITNNLPKDSVCQGLFTEVGHFGVILAQAETINLCQGHAYIPKEVNQQKYAPQKAIAVVSPLMQQVVADSTFTKNPTKVKVGGLETRSVPNKNDHQPNNLQTLQPTSNESDVKTLYADTSQTKVPSKSLLANGISHCVKNAGPVENKQLPGQNESLSSVPPNNVSRERKGLEQPYPTDDECGVNSLSENVATVMGGNFKGIETTMDARMDNLSAIPVNEWSLQRLHTLMTDLEQMQEKQQKEFPFNDLISEILKRFWNGDYTKLCNAAKSDIYINIMEEVILHRGRENSVILHECSRARLNEMASSVLILDHGVTPPKMTYKSSWLNLGEEFYIIDKENDCPLPSVVMQHKPKFADKEVPMKEMKSMQEPINEKITISYKAAPPLPHEHQKNLSVKDDKMVRKEPVGMDNENTCSVKETEGQDSVTKKNVKIKSVQSDNLRTKGENEALLLGSSSTQSSDVNGSCLKPGNLHKLPATSMAPVLDKNGIAGSISAELSILPPEKEGRLFTGEPDEEVKKMQKEDAQILTDSKGQVSVELKAGNLHKLPTTGMAPVLDKNGFPDSISAELSILPPEKEGRLFTGEPDDEVKKMQKDDAQILTDSKGQVSVELVDQDQKLMDPEIKPDEGSNRIKIIGHLENYCCLAKWFQVLGYRNGGLCKCEKKAELRHHPDKLDRGGQEVNVDKGRHPVSKVCKLTDSDGCVLRDNEQAKNKLVYRRMSGKKSVTSSIDDPSLDDIEIVDVITNYEDVLKMANEMSEQLMETPCIARTSHESTTSRKHGRDHKKITAPTQINLTLFGTSNLKQMKGISEFMALDKAQLPPKTINVRLDSASNEYPNNTKNQILKQEVWNSWKKTYVPLKMSNKRPKKQKHAKAPEPKNDAADSSTIKTTAFDLITRLRSHEDLQTHRSEATDDKRKCTDTDRTKKKSWKNISSTIRDKLKKWKRKKISASFNLKKRRNYTNNGSKPVKSSFDLSQAINTSKNKLNTGSALNFGVLPESFSISDGSSSMEANLSASADSGSTVKNAMRLKRRWSITDICCDSPRKKCLKSTPTLPSASGSSTFQEFKKKYEEKRQRIPT